MSRHAVERPESHHRDIQGGAARAAVFGVSDGLVTNVSLILGIAGARIHTGPGVVRLAGLAGLIAGSVSMASGEYVSVRAQRELFERELDMERRELGRRPHVEQVELSLIYQSRGVDPDVARQLATEMMRDPELALQTHAREELGIDPGALGSPWKAALSSFLTFGVGALVPLLPWLFTRGAPAVGVSIVLTAIAALAVGLALARFTGRSRIRTALRQLLIAALAATVTFGVGRAVGVGVG
ncbi:MAG: VIT1/CCC1 transporter family protein [Acidimicrobiales bacterium]